jgi:hypothetical protein
MRSQNQLPQGSKYLSRENVDLYFQDNVVNRTIQPTGASRIVNALVHFAENLEYPAGDFSVQSPLVKAALAVHQAKFQERMKNPAANADPHAKLPTDIMSDEQVTEAAAYILQHNTQNWKDMMLSWTTCEQEFVRWDALKKLELKDLKFNVTHCRHRSPGVLHGMMTKILQRVVHKERAFTKRVVGGWRHRYWKRCSTGILAMNLFVRLFDNQDIHFCKAPDPRSGKKIPYWQTVSLLTEWSSAKSAHTAYDRVMKACGIRATKVTHLRKQGMETGSIAGLTQDQLSTLSKHISGKVARYVTELYPPTLAVKAGFKNEEDYFVPRDRLRPPVPHFNVTDTMFPLRRRWIEQQAGPRGDKTRAAHAFLHELLPFLAMVAFQDGVFWIHEYPNHEASRLLLHVMPDWYPAWAEWARGFVTYELSNQQRSKVARLNQAAQASYNCLRQELHTYQRRNEQGIQKIHDLMLLEERRRAAMAVTPSPTAASGQRRGASAPAVPPEPRRLPLEEAAAPSQQEQQQARPVMQTIHHRIPAFPVSLPATFVRLLEEHRRFNLDSFEKSTSKNSWGTGRRVAFSKRMYLYKKIVAQAHLLRGNDNFDRSKMKRAAEMLDHKRTNARKTLSKFLEVLKQEDPATKARKRRRDD